MADASKGKKEALDIQQVLAKAGKRALGGGLPGAAAMGVQGESTGRKRRMVGQSSALRHAVLPPANHASWLRTF